MMRNVFRSKDASYSINQAITAVGTVFRLAARGRGRDGLLRPRPTSLPTSGLLASGTPPGSWIQGGSYLLLG